LKKRLFLWMIWMVSLLNKKSHQDWFPAT
jgi:hypothetical protein